MKVFGIKKVNDIYSEIAYGKPKPIDEVTLQDMQENPIWIFALDEEEAEGIDETWQKPILRSDNVIHELLEAYILLKSVDGQYDISANLDIKEETLDDVNYWNTELECWLPIENVENYKELQFVAIPKIEGDADIIFGFNDTKNVFCSIRSRQETTVKKRNLSSFLNSLFRKG